MLQGASHGAACPHLAEHDGRVLMCISHSQKKQLDEALAHYNKAIELDPNEISFLTNRAAVLFEQCKYDECIKVCCARRRSRTRPANLWLTGWKPLVGLRRRRGKGPPRARRLQGMLHAVVLPVLRRV